MMKRASPSRFLLEWICPAFATHPVGSHSFSGIAETYSHLVHLQLRGIPHSGCISPEVMTTALFTNHVDQPRITLAYF
jgi:hypothetical protein